MLKKFLQVWIVLIGMTALNGGNKVVPYAPVKEHLIIPKGMHLLSAKAVDGSVIEFEDGAQLEVSEQDRAEVLEWKNHAPLTIFPKYCSFLSSLNCFCCQEADFCVTNLHTETTVSVTYVASPILDHKFTNLICHIDPYAKEIYLTMGSKGNLKSGNVTRWKIESSDFDTYVHNQWQKGETVIIGVYDNAFSRFSKFKSILISYENFNKVKFIRANSKPL